MKTNVKKSVKKATKKVAKKATKKAAKKAPKKATNKAKSKSPAKPTIKKTTKVSSKHIVESVLRKNPSLVNDPNKILTLTWKQQLNNIKKKEEWVSAKQLFEMLLIKELASPSTVERIRTAYLLNLKKIITKTDYNKMFTTAA